jgi:hypothetical protein
MPAMTDSDRPDALDPAQIAALMRASTSAVAAEVRALDVLATVRPAPGEWCANEVVGHLLEADRRGYTGRIRTVLAEDRPIFETWDPPTVAAAREDDLRDSAALLGELLMAREAGILMVEALGPDDLERAGVHPVVGVLTVGNLAHEWVHHDRAHLAQLLTIAQVIVRPALGNARRFNDPEA